MDITSYLLGKKASGGGSGGLDWSALGYNETPSLIVDIYNYALDIQNDWVNVSDLSGKFRSDGKLSIMPLVDTSNATNMANMFNDCGNLKNLPLLDTSKVISMAGMFQNCSVIETIPLFDTSSVVNMNKMFSGCKELKNIPLLDTSNIDSIASYHQNIFSNCNNLTDESLDNILNMCINMKNVSSSKTLAYIGISSTYYSTSKIEALPHYQDFINAGWTIGY